MDEKNCFRPDRLFSLKGEVVLVTGSAGQLGKSLLQALVGFGAKVVATDSSEMALESLSNQGQWDAEKVLFSVCDIQCRSRIDDVLKLSAKKFGQVTGLVANAGISVFEHYLKRTDEAVDRVMDVNLKGTLISNQEFIKHCIERGGGGTIVNIASHYGVVSPDPRIYTDCDRNNSEIYGATKAGIIQMTRYFAVHAAEHCIRTNVVSPGGIRNPESPQGEDFQKNYSYRCPMGRMAETNEVLGAILFLLSPAASYINGQNIIVDGGTTCW